MSPERKENSGQAEKMAKRHEMWETAKRHLPEGVVAGTGLTFGLSLVFWYLKRKSKDLRPEIDEIEKRALSEIEAKTPSLGGSELAALAVIKEEVAPDLEELAEKGRGGRKLVGILKKICRLSDALPGARKVDELVLGATIKALEGVEALLKPEEPSKN